MTDVEGLSPLLIVDDEPYVREGLKGLINWERCGFSICGEAAHGMEALELIEQHRPHLVVTDVRMPEMDGLELIKRATTELKANCKFIILSGYSDFKYAQTAMKYNVKDYILKPIEEDELTDALIRLRHEIAGEIEKQRETSAGIRSKADDALRRLMKGDVDRDTTSFAARQLGCRGPMLFVMVEVLNVRQWLSERDNAGIQSNLARIHASVLAAIGQQNALCVLRDEPSWFLILAQQAILGRYRNNEAELCRRLQSECSAGGQYRIVVYAGKLVERMENLKDSFDSCTYARDRDFFDRKPGTIFYEEVKSRAFNYNVTNVIPYADLLNAVVSCRKESIHGLVEELFRSLQAKYLAPDVVRACIVSVLLDVAKAVSERNGDADMLFSQFNINAMQAMTAEELKESLRAICISGAEYIKSQKESTAMGVMADVEAYIRRNYKEDVSLRSIAEHFFIHPVYLGHQFKKSYGLYLNDYINKLRIDEAGKLLETTDWKVHEIARKVGFADPDYFIKKFKIAKGSSPSQFRNMASLEADRATTSQE